jgi:hypothetical protein
MKPFSILTLLLSIVLAGIILIASALYDILSHHNPDPTVMVQTPTRDEINNAVARLIQAGRSQEVYSFYAQDVGDPIRAMLYVSAALTNHAPIHLVMSVGWYEGGHIVGKVDGPNENGSFDVRPMGLNSITYKQYSLTELAKIEFNIPQGVIHLVAERVKWGVTWESAMAVYNKGRPDGLDSRQIDYVTFVLRHEWQLDRRFAVRFADAL